MEGSFERDLKGIRRVMVEEEVVQTFGLLPFLECDQRSITYLCCHDIAKLGLLSSVPLSVSLQHGHRSMQHCV